jgi:hypothetical protein
MSFQSSTSRGRGTDVEAKEEEECPVIVHAGLMRELEGWAETLAGTFKAQEVANTLWTYTTMEREPGAGMMRELEGRAEALAGTFKAQEVANTLWLMMMMPFNCSYRNKSEKRM